MMKNASAKNIHERTALNNRERWQMLLLCEPIEKLTLVDNRIQ
jgi:hypothetical protein